MKNQIIIEDENHLIYKDINNFIETTRRKKEESGIDEVYACKYKENYIGIVFINFHAKIRNLSDELEIGVGILKKYQGKRIGTLIEKELVTKLLEVYPKFNEIVTQVDNDNIPSIKAVKKAGFVEVSNEEYSYYSFKR